MIDTFKPSAPVNQAPEFNCGNCAHAVKERMPQQLVSQLVCHANPPQAVCVPASNSSYQIMTLFPMVQPQQYCHQHKLLADHVQAS